MNRKPKLKNLSLNTNAVEFPPKEEPKSVSDWNCGLTQHICRNYSIIVKTKLCFKYGMPDVTIKNYHKCLGNGKTEKGITLFQFLTKTGSILRNF